MWVENFARALHIYARTAKGLFSSICCLVLPSKRELNFMALSGRRKYGFLLRQRNHCCACQIEPYACPMCAIRSILRKRPDFEKMKNFQLIFISFKFQRKVRAFNVGLNNQVFYVYTWHTCIIKLRIKAEQKSTGYGPKDPCFPWGYTSESYIHN